MRRLLFLLALLSSGPCHSLLLPIRLKQCQNIVRVVLVCASAGVSGVSVGVSVIAVTLMCVAANGGLRMVSRTCVCVCAYLILFGLYLFAHSLPCIGTRESPENGRGLCICVRVNIM
jgi:hypothetical protein